MKQFVPAILFLFPLACSSIQKTEAVRAGLIQPGISMSEDIHPADIRVDEPVRDTLKVKDAQGREMLIMKAIKDENGEMVASDAIPAVMVSARFRNVAERGGKIDLRFDVMVPSELMESRWQLRLQPVLVAGGESSELEPIYITGEKYRRSQLRGYQRYAKFLQSIVADTTVFLDTGQVEIFLKRNIPELYALKNDSSIVSEARFESLYGVTRKEALLHYTDKFRLRLNSHRKAMTGKMFRRYVKSPIGEKGVRLDSIVTALHGDLLYNYVQTLPAGPGLRKAEVYLGGGVYEEGREICDLPDTGPLTFYISSLSGLAVDIQRYVFRVVERRAEARSAYFLEFTAGSSQLDPSLGNNSEEMSRISGHLEELLTNEDYDLDSIVVAASCSPEGSWASNSILSGKRSEEVCRYYSNLRARDTVRLDFIPRGQPENWSLLELLAASDTVLSPKAREEIASICRDPDPDRRERRLSELPSYHYLRECIYPQLRMVCLDFYLHRRGMVKDTIHTTVPDTLYARGLQALKSRNYKAALELLRPYSDMNTAIAYCALNYNASALAVLEGMPDDARQEYMKALIHVRCGEDADAVECYLKACEMDPSFVHRGNLDPEISGLKNKYKIADKL